MSRASDEPEADLPGEAPLPGLLPEPLGAELIAFRRDLHMHPELGNQEFRTTAAIKKRLEAAGLEPRVLDSGTGLLCDVGTWKGDGPCWRSGRTSTPCRSRTPRSTRRTARPSPIGRTPAATTSTPPPCSAPVWSLPSSTVRACCPTRSG